MEVPPHQDWMEVTPPPPPPVGAGWRYRGTPCNGLMGVLRVLSGDRVATWRAVCLLHSHKRTFLLNHIYIFAVNSIARKVKHLSREAFPQRLKYFCNDHDAIEN